jgi:hypothetical protein
MQEKITAELRASNWWCFVNIVVSCFSVLAAAASREPFL